MFKFDEKAHDKLFDKFKEKTRIIKIVTDGIISVKHYERAPIRLLWILKEVHDSGDGGWDLRGFIAGGFSNDDEEIYPRWRSTYGLIAKVSAGVLRSQADFNNAHQVTTKIEVAVEILKEIAVINVNKYPGGSTTNWDSLEKSFKIFKPSLLRQIELINPHIIICAGTFSLFHEASQAIDKSDNRTWSLEVDGRLWLGAYHPGQRTITHEQYFTSIMDKVVPFLQRIKQDE